jgi:hypothetical protein
MIANIDDAKPILQALQSHTPGKPGQAVAVMDLKRSTQRDLRQLGVLLAHLQSSGLVKRHGKMVWLTTSGLNFLAKGPASLSLLH